MDYYFNCIKCGKKTEDSSQVCKHDKYYNHIEILYDYSKIRETFSEDEKKKLLNNFTFLEDEKIITLGEGNTPLIKIENFSDVCKKNNVYVKNEGQNPTGSFKDRESSFAVSKAKMDGHDKIISVSSGNAALSATVYGNKAKMKCESFVPKDTSESKRKILQLFGSEFHLEDGDYEQIYREIIDRNITDGKNITSGQDVFREEGSKKIAFEIWGDVGIPDVVIVPVGNGTLFASVFKGFKELNLLGLADKMPKIFGVQVKEASPLAKAVDTGKDYAILGKIPDSVAEGIIARESYDSPKVIRAINEGFGSIIEVTENEIKLALKDIIKKESLVPEPTSASVYAALNKIDDLKLVEGLNIVCVQTGNGMKNLDEILKIVDKK